MPRQKPTAFRDILQQLHDERAALTPRLLSRLSGLPQTDLAAFAETWVATHAERRRDIARRMVDLAEEDYKLDFAVLFRYMFNDDDEGVRAAGIEGLWESEDATLVKPLVGFLRSDPDALVRAAAADALGRFVLLGEYGRLPERYVDLICEALLATTRSVSEDIEVRCRAVEAIAYWSNDIVREVIDRAYEDDVLEMRASAVAAMGHTADTFWREITEAELESPDAQMRFQAARATGELENRQAAPRLIELLDDESREVQGAAIVALGQVGGAAAKNALTQTAQSDDEILRVLASEALEELTFASDADFLLLDLDSAPDDEKEDDE